MGSGAARGMASSRAQALALILGTAVGFCAAVAIGHAVTDYSKPSNFKRFYPQLTPAAGFYPTFSMLENLALARWKPGKTVVIIGGNSILNGIGQSESELWSLRLQDRLGERYSVVNLAFPGAYPSEGGALVAESLLRQGIPVIYVANYNPGPVARAYESIYTYFYWDAFYKGKLLPNPGRDVELARRIPLLQQPDKDKIVVGRLDAKLRFEELWNHVAYRYVSTIWNNYIQRDSWKPRADIPDSVATAPPVAERFRDNFDVEMLTTRGFSQTFAEPDGTGGWRVTQPPFVQATEDIDEIFVPQLRARMLMLLSENCPFYRDRLTPPERARDLFAFAAYEKLWREHGVACVTIGTDFDPADYRDRTHLSASGGLKLADIVADQVRRFPVP